jgi:phosphopantetheine adenylyltransferase/dephospho-CoA kinase
MHVIGLTGGICSGKSTITSFLQEAGVRIIDADKLGHQAYVKDSACYFALIRNFGDGIVNAETREIDRRVLGSIVFGSEEKMKELKAIVWPEIRRLATEEIQQLEIQGEKLCIVEAAVMIEAGWQDMANSVWVVNVDPEIAIQRLMRRNNLSEGDARSRLAAQLTNGERNKFAHEVIANDDDQSKEELKAVVLGLLDKEKRKGVSI